MKKYIAELFATMILVLVGVGGASLIAQTSLQAGFMFFLGVILLAYTFGNISGGHANPSITVGHYFSGKLSLTDTIYYIVFQIIGALIAGFILFVISNYDISLLATNQVAPDYDILQAAVVEFTITLIFVLIILRVTSLPNLANTAPIFIAITLAIMVGIAIPITNGSLNFARSLSIAIYSKDALSSLWVFLVFPTLGGAVAGLINKYFFTEK